jgi:hypothetical protein
MALAPEPDRTAIRLAERLIQLLGRGGFTATYKYAVLIAIMDLCMELTSATGLPPDMITTRQLAEKVIEIYWPHCIPHPEARRVLRQIRGKEDMQAEIIQHIVEFRENADVTPAASLPLSRARAASTPEAYEKLARLIEWKLVEMPLPLLQVIGGEEDRFLYEYGFVKGISKRVVNAAQQGTSLGFDNRLLLKPGISAAFIALNGILRPMIHGEWARLVTRMNGLTEPSLEEFLFGSTRISLEPVRSGLREIQDGRCFYCERSLGASCHIDHFVPWARHADNSIDNLVAAHEDCNGKKSDYLAAADHVVRWRERSARRAGDLAEIAREEAWETRPERTLSVARAIYQMLPDDARLWLSGQSFLVIDRPRIASALAA